MPPTLKPTPTSSLSSELGPLTLQPSSWSHEVHSQEKPSEAHTVASGFKGIEAWVGRGDFFNKNNIC